MSLPKRVSSKRLLSLLNNSVPHFLSSSRMDFDKAWREIKSSSAAFVIFKVLETAMKGGFNKALENTKEKLNDVKRKTNELAEEADGKLDHLKYLAEEKAELMDERVDQLKYILEDKFEDFKIKAQDLIEDMEVKAEEIKEVLGNKAENILDKIENKIDELTKPKNKV